jgi:hypothetical protein
LLPNEWEHGYGERRFKPFQGFFRVLPTINAISISPTIGMMISENSGIGHVGVVSG